jgi:hypothetical protein
MTFKYYTIEDTGNGYYKAYPKQITVKNLDLFDYHEMIRQLWKEPDFFCFYVESRKQYQIKDDIEKSSPSTLYKVFDISPKYSDTMPTEYKGKPVMVIE